MVDVQKFKDEEALGYQIDIVGRNVQVTEAMKNYAWEKLSKIERLHSKIMHVHATLDIQKLEHVVSLIIKFDHVQIKVQASSTDMYASIDEAIKRLQKLTRKWKSRIQEHNNKDLTSVDMQVNVIRRPYDEVEEFNAEIENGKKKESIPFFAAKVIDTEMQLLKVLTQDEALMKMELSGDHFLVYRGEEDRKLKVIYRRPDGNYGILLPE